MSKRVKLGSPKVAIAYIRVSTEDQKLGPQAQRASIEAWAAREGVSVAACYVDQGVSGAKALDERPALLNAITALHDHCAGLLVTMKRDRIGRDLGVTALIDRAVRASGAKLVTTDGASNADGIEGTMLRGMQDLFAQVEREMIRARTRAALHAKKVRGECVGQVPYGFVREGDRLVAVRAEQETIDRARQVAGEGRRLRAVAATLTAVGRTSRNSRPFVAVQVARMLRASAHLAA